MRRTNNLDDIEPDNCAFCAGTGQVVVGYSGLVSAGHNGVLGSDRSIPIIEPCEQCEQERNCTHDWHWVKDWYGDHNVVGGICDASRWVCRKCNAHNTTAPRSTPWDGPDPDDARDRQND